MKIAKWVKSLSHSCHTLSLPRRDPLGWETSQAIQGNGHQASWAQLTSCLLASTAFSGATTL